MLVVIFFCFQFFDLKYGEWFGYFNQKGEVIYIFKGGLFKGMLIIYLRGF